MTYLQTQILDKLLVDEHIDEDLYYDILFDLTNDDIKQLHDLVALICLETHFFE